MHRRDVLKTLPVLAAGAAFLGRDAAAQAPAGARLPIGWQFGTPRATPDANKAAMEEIRAIGYDMIEPAGFGTFDPALLRKQAEEVGIRIRSIHVGNDQQAAFFPRRIGGPGPGGAPPAPPPPPARGVPRRRPQNILEIQDATYSPAAVAQIARVTAPLVRDAGIEWAVLGASAISSFASVDAIRRYGDAFNKANDIFKAAGVKMSYHSHEFDFEMVGGRMGFDVLVEHTDPSIRMQVDLGWAAFGGADPIAIVNRHASRLALFHLRDMKDNNLSVAGDGVFNWPALVQAIRKVPDPICHVEGGDAKVAFANMQKFGFGRG